MTCGVINSFDGLKLGRNKFKNQIEHKRKKIPDISFSWRTGCANHLSLGDERQPLFRRAVSG